MNNSSKQVADMRPGKGITVAESDEQQRNWSDERWERGQKEGNYDRTRAHLNFEVAKGGKIQPIDTSKSITQKMAERLAQLGIKDPNEGLRMPRFRTLAKFILGGSRDRMHELAYGSADIVDLTKGADNSHVTRQKGIEDWAKDMYKYIADKYGEDNIVGFYVHLDETNVHCHCSVVPIDENGYLSYRRVFKGESLVSYRENTTQIHNEIAEVNKKYGLSRGTNTQVTGSKHVSNEDYKRNLSEECTNLEQQITSSKKTLESLDQDIKKAEKRVKGLTTMIKNLEAEKAALNEQIAELQHLAETGDIDSYDAEKQIAELRGKLAETQEKLDDKQAKLVSAEAILADLQEQIKVGQSAEEQLRQMRTDATADLMEQAHMRVSHSLLPDLINDYRRLKPQMSFTAQAEAEDTLLNDLAENGNEILKLAALLYIGYVDQSTMVAEGGGGGTTSDLPWGRDKDEDDMKWAHRCMLKARSMVKSSGGRKR